MFGDATYHREQIAKLVIDTQRVQQEAQKVLAADERR
jgi:hypothetical protein